MARSYAPEILTGTREPRAVRLEAMQEVAAAPLVPTPTDAPDGVTVYVSKYRRYRVQITAPHTFIDPATGRKSAGSAPYAAVFDDGVYRNNHRDLKMRALIDEALQTNPYFGKFGSIAHFWLASEQRAITEAAQLKSALDTLKKLPKEAVDQFVAGLTQGDAEDHELAPAPQRGVRPIPSQP